jgi:hypothetical protein
MWVGLVVYAILALVVVLALAFMAQAVFRFAPRVLDDRRVTK